MGSWRIFCRSEGPRIIVSALAIVVSLLGLTEMAAARDRQVLSRPDTTWFSDAGYGIFLHWGAYSTAAGRWEGKERTKDLWGEWLRVRASLNTRQYEELAGKFNPSGFRPEQWAEVFKQAGARYVILTAKHHEGFAMYRSQASRFNSYDWPEKYHGEPVRELGDAVRRQGLKFGVYYSQKIDWYHTGRNTVCPTFSEYFEKICVPQVTELLTGYGPLAVMWFDIGIGDAKQVQRLKEIVRKNQPDCLISPRIGTGGGDYQGGGDNEVPGETKPAPWESCMTLNHHWATYPQDIYQKSAREVIRLLADIRSKGGNMLLDIGPDAEGRLAPRDVVVLRQVGQWLDTFGASIYGVRATPLARVPWGRVTAGPGNLLYLHVFDMPRDGVVLLPGIRGKIEKAWLLGDTHQSPLNVRTDGKEDHLVSVDATTAPAVALNADDMVVAVRLSPDSQYDTAYLLDGEFNNDFPPSVARLSGGAEYRHERVVYKDIEDPAIEKARYDEIATMRNSASSLAWDFRTLHPGDYHVVASYANPEGCRGRISVKIDDEVFGTPLESTPGNPADRFGKSFLGTVAIRADGPHTMMLSVSGTEKDKPVLINDLMLIPTRTSLLNAGKSSK